jgi:hypothetical protein
MTDQKHLWEIIDETHREIQHAKEAYLKADTLINSHLGDNSILLGRHKATKRDIVIWLHHRLKW